MKQTVRGAPVKAPARRNSMHRRAFVSQSLLAALGTSLPAGHGVAAAPPPADAPPQPLRASADIKLGMRLPPRMSDDALTLMRQLNFRWCRLDLNPEDATETFMRETAERYARGGVRIFSATCRFARAVPNALEPAGLDRRIALTQNFIRVLGHLGIANFETSFNSLAPGSQVYSTGTGTVRGIAVRRFDLAKFRGTEAPPSRRYSADEITGLFDRYLASLLPVAAKAGVRIALHPDDPPIAEMGGVARIFHHVEHFDRAFKRHPNPNFGVLFCVGTWAEGGTAMGATVAEAIRHFAAQGRLVSVHFRNVSSALPVFEETFMDDGCLDMQAIMDALVAANFGGLVVPDHIPDLALETDLAVRTTPDRYESPFCPVGVAYSAGLMNAYLQNALRKHGRA